MVKVCRRHIDLKDILFFLNNAKLKTINKLEHTTQRLRFIRKYGISKLKYSGSRRGGSTENKGSNGLSRTVFIEKLFSNTITCFLNILYIHMDNWTYEHIYGYSPLVHNKIKVRYTPGKSCISIISKCTKCYSFVALRISFNKKHSEV